MNGDTLWTQQHSRGVRSERKKERRIAMKRVTLSLELRSTEVTLMEFKVSSAGIMHSVNLVLKLSTALSSEPSGI